jgi:hypothetical protein
MLRTAPSREGCLAPSLCGLSLNPAQAGSLRTFELCECKAGARARSANAVFITASRHLVTAMPKGA